MSEPARGCHTGGRLLERSLHRMRSQGGRHALPRAGVPAMCVPRCPPAPVRAVHGRVCLHAHHELHTCTGCDRTRMCSQAHCLRHVRAHAYTHMCVHTPSHTHIVRGSHLCRLTPSRGRRVTLLRPPPGGALRVGTRLRPAQSAEPGDGRFAGLAAGPAAAAGPGPAGGPGPRPPALHGAPR